MHYKNALKYEQVCSSTGGNLGLVFGVIQQVHFQLCMTFKCAKIL